MTAIPTQIRPYHVRREIGRGGMAIVYLARDERLQRDVAIKVLAPDMAREPDRLARFKREARLIAQLNHPNIAQIYHLLEIGDRTGIVLEYVPGRSLAEIIDREGPLEPKVALDVCAQIARAMEAAHARGIVHRDLKPANIRVTDDGTANVLDFGIARGAGRQGTVHHHLIVGTPGYMAPEQALGKPVDARADIFSFGCVLYETLTGERAFAGGDTIDQLGTAALNVEPDWSTLPRSLAAPARRVLQACLAPDPADRVPSMTVVLSALNAALGVTPGPEPTPLAAVPNNLPQPVTSFVGRAGQLDELSDLLSRERLITLTGAGGCGKTRLSIELARRTMGAFPDGAYLVELAPTADPRYVPGAVAAALGVKDRPNKMTAESLCEHLAERTVLLVLDNCEHVLDAASSLTEMLLAAAPGLRIVATTREALHLAGEHLWPVPGLTVPGGDDAEAIAGSEAATLFAVRSRTLKPGFRLDETVAPAVARICRRLDGIPLAIELAAARVRALTPQQIDERLDDRLRLLVDDTRGAVERHRTLRATVDWSYRMLSESEKRLLRMLSVFAGGCTIEGAVAVAGPGGRVEDGADLDELGVIDLLTRLIDKSLLTVCDECAGYRYRLLETVRQYAAEQLDRAGESRAAFERHLDYHVAMAERLEPMLTASSQAASLEQIELQHENMLVALDHCENAEGGANKALRLCAALMRFWMLRGHYKTALGACSRALARPEAQAPTAHRSAVLHAAGVMASDLGDYELAEWYAAEALSIERQLGNREGVARSLNSRGNIAYYQGDLRGAQALHEQSLAIQRELGNTAGIARSLNNLGNVATDLGHVDEACRFYEEALAINRKRGNPAGEAINLNNLGLLAYHAGDFRTAQALHEESLTLRRELGDKHGIAESLSQLGKVSQSEGDLARARRLTRESLAMRRELGEKLGLADSLDDCAALAARLDEPARAARLLSAADRLRKRIGTPRAGQEQKELDAALASALDTLGRAFFDEVALAGRALSLDDGLDEAMRWLDEIPPQSEVPTLLMPG